VLVNSSTVYFSVINGNLEIAFAAQAIKVTLALVLLFSLSAVFKHRCQVSVLVCV
jgi:hypothetical protein